MVAGEPIDMIWVIIFIIDIPYEKRPSLGVQLLHAFGEIDERGTDITHHHLFIKKTIDIVFIVRLKFTIEILLVAALNGNRIVYSSLLAVCKK